ncbi:MAG: transketolase [Anaerolineae bacterium]
MADRPIEEVAGLERMAALMRCDIVRMIQQAGQGHPGGSLSAADILAALYFRVMRIDPGRPGWPDRDRFVLSKGHACPAWYSALIRRGYLGVECMGTLRCLDSLLQGHPDMLKTPGVDMTAGSLGHGLSAGLGMALAARVTGRDYRTWVIIGDGEMQEGSIWEAALVAPNLKLSNLTVILDRNRIQNDDFVDKVMPIEPVSAKWEAFGWQVVEIDGHDMAQVVEALEASREAADGPVLIVAQTVKGKGVSYMENNPFWHGNAPSAEQADVACAEIFAAAGLTEGEDGC